MAAPSPQQGKPGSKLESLPKEELLKFIKKQAASVKDLKKKIDGLSEDLKKEKNETERLENEKKDWLSRGISAEFEKKEKLMKKEKELQLAAELGKEMLAENDDLQLEIDELKKGHEEQIRSYENEIEELVQQKGTLEAAVKAWEEDYRSAIKEAHDCREELKATLSNHESLDNHNLVHENEELKNKIKQLEHQVVTHPSTSKYNKIKEKYDELSKEHKYTKDACLAAEEECRKKSERLVALDKEMKNFKKQIADYQKQLRSSHLEIEALGKTNDQLRTSMSKSEEQIKALEERNQKLKQEKESTTKSLKSMKTKLERASQMEEELKKQLNNIVHERDELMRKQQQKRQQSQKKGKGVSKETDWEKINQEKDECIKELQNLISSLEQEKSELENGLSNMADTKNNALEKYQKLLKDFEVTTKNYEVEKENNRLMQCESDTFVEEINVLNEKIKALEHVTSSKDKTSKKTSGKKGKKDATLPSSVAELKKNIGQYEDENEELASKVEKLEIENEMFRAKSPDNKATILRLENRVDDLLIQLQTLNEEKHNQETELEELFKTFDDLQTKYDFECREREIKEKEIHALEEKLQKKEQGQDKTTLELEEQISQLHESVKEITINKDYLKQEVTVKEEYIEQLRNEIEQLRNEGNNINNRDSESHIYGEYEELDRQFVQTKQILKQVLEENERYKIKIDELRNDNQEKEKVAETPEFEQTEKFFEDKEEVISEKILKYDKEVVSLSEKLVAAEQMIVNLKETNVENERVISVLQAEKNSLIQEISLIKADKVEISKLNEDYVNEIKRLNSGLTHMQDIDKIDANNQCDLLHEKEDDSKEKSDFQMQWENSESTELKEQIKNLQEKLSLLEKENIETVNASMSEKETVELKMKELEQKLANLTEEKDEIASSKKTEVNQLSIIIEGLEEKLNLINNEKKDVDLNKTRSEELEFKLRDLELKSSSSNAEKEKIVFDKCKEIEELQEHIKNIERNLSTTTSEKDKIIQNIHKENKSLENDLALFDKEYRRISTENEHIRAKFDGLLSSKGEHLKQIEELKVKLSFTEKEMLRLNDELKDFEDLCKEAGFEKIDQLKEIISSSQGINKLNTFLKDELASSNRKIEELSELLANNQLEVSKLEIENENLKDSSKFLEVRINKVEEDKITPNEENALESVCGDESEKNIVKETNRIGAILKEQHDELKILYEEERSKNEDFQAQIYNLKNEVIIGNEQKQVLEEHRDDIQKLLEQKTTIIDRLNENIEDLEQKLAGMSARFQNLTEEIEGKNNIIANLENELQKQLEVANNGEVLYETNGETKAELDEKMHDLKKELNEKDTKIAELQNLLIEASESGSGKESEILSLQNSSEKLREVYNQLKEEMINYKSASENHLNEMYEKENIINDLKGKITALSKSLEQCHIKIHEFAEKCNSLKDDIAIYDENNKAIQREANSLKDQLIVKEENCNALKDEITNKNEKIEKIIKKFKTNKENMSKKEEELNQKTLLIEKLKSSGRENMNKKDEEINQKNSTVEKLKNICKEKEQEIKNLHMELKHIATCLEEFEKESKTKEQQLSLMEELKRENELLLHDKLDNENRFAEIKSKFDTLQEEYDTLVEKYNIILNEKENWNTEMNAYKYQIEKEKEKYEQIIEEKAHELKVLKSQTLKLDELSQTEELKNEQPKISELEDKCSLLQDENKMLAEDLMAAQNHCKELSVVIEEQEKAKDYLSKLEEELQSALNKVDELDESLKIKTEEIENLGKILQEKNEKMQKFKNMAIKVKKELDTLRAQCQEDKINMEAQATKSFEDNKVLKEELVRQKTECAKHEEDYLEMQNEIKEYEEKLITSQTLAEEYKIQNEKYQQSMDKLTLEMCTKEETVIALEKKIKELEANILNKAEIEQDLETSKEQLLNKEEEIARLTKELSLIKETLDSKEKETHQMSMMNLEINDYLKTIESLNDKLNVSKEQSSQLENEKEECNKKIKTVESEINSLKEEKVEFENMTRKLKQMIMKLKKENGDTKKQVEELEQAETGLQKTIDEMILTQDESKIEIARLTAEKTTLKEQLKRSNEIHEKSYKSLEVKYARSNNDLIAAQTLYQELQEEYENYKVRAHNVLKQQRSVKTDSQKEFEKKEKTRLEEIIEDLKLKLQENGHSLNILQGEHGELEINYERLQSKYNELAQQISDSEVSWKQRYSQLKSESSSKTNELEQINKNLSEKNEYIESFQKEMESKFESKEETLVKEINDLKEEIIIYQRKLDAATSQNLQQRRELNKQGSNDSKDLSLDLSKTVLERQEGEGMDSRELELIDSLSQRSSVPQTPLSPSNAAVLETLLSDSDSSSTPKSPFQLKDEMVNLKSALLVARKKNEHITLLLRDSEENTSRLTEQAKVLKDEIRRLERNAQREEAISNLEYLKNVIIKFLQVNSTEKEQLIPVLCTMLKLSAEEKNFIMEFARGDDADIVRDENSWSSYVYRWTSLS